MRAPRNGLEDIVVEERDGGGLDGDCARVVQGLVVAEEVHVSGNEEGAYCAQRHSGAEHEVEGEPVVPCGEPRHHQVGIFHRETVRESAAEHVEPERPTDYAEKHVVPQVVERGKLLRGNVRSAYCRGIRRD